MMKMTLIIYRILQISAFINVHCQTNQHELHLCDQYYLEATFTVPEVWSENSICIFIATQRECERMMCTQHAANQSCSSNLKRRTLHCVWRMFPQRGDYFVSPWAGLFFPHSKRCVSVFIIPLPLGEIAHAVIAREKSERCTVALSRSSEKLSYEWHYQNSILDD